MKIHFIDKDNGWGILETGGKFYVVNAPEGIPELNKAARLAGPFKNEDLAYAAANILAAY